MYPDNSLADGLAVAGVIPPATTANTARVSGAINLATFDQLLFVFQLGDMASETIDGGVQTCDSDGTSNAVDISGKTLTQLAASATANDNKQVVINIKSVDLIANGKQYVRARLITGGATGGPAGCVVLGVPRYGPATGANLASVTQVIR